MRVLLGRGVPWFADLATRVAEGLPDDSFGQFAFAAELVRVSEAPIPTNDSFVRGWVRECFIGPESRERLRADPFLAVLLPASSRSTVSVPGWTGRRVLSTAGEAATG